MKNCKQKYILLVVIFFIGSLVLTWKTMSPRTKGMATAYMHRVIGYKQIMTYGLPTEGWGEYRDLLYQKYGVSVVREAGCLVTADIRDFVKGYNEIAEPWILKKFDHDVFEECLKEGKKLRKEKLKKLGLYLESEDQLQSTKIVDCLLRTSLTFQLKKSGMVTLLKLWTQII